ncbi:MAG: hypothetical protein LBN39_05740 [Planctomycetaceae bacterium]|jgi:hypothetical protein|nr:hypothetical protein [Planctomycetaceae bacterium]
MKRTAFLFVCAALMTATAFAAEWKPAGDKIATEFAKQVNPKNPLPEYPRPQLERQAWKNLNGLWDYAVVAKDAKFEKADGKILVPFAIESALSGVGKTVGKDKTLWYKTAFTVPKGKQWDGQRIVLHFGAVDWKTDVFVNGKKVGDHTGGYSPFYFDITDALKDGENELTLSVWDPTTDGYQPFGKQHNNPHGIWYTAVTGIWQTVWLEPVPATAIKSVKYVPNIKDGKLTITADIANLKDGDQLEATATFTVKEGKINRRFLLRRETAKTAKKPVSSKIGKANEPLILDVPNPKLWTPDEPNLYDLTLSVVRDGKPVDTVNSYFGMREITLGKTADGITRMLLNGKFVFQHGPLDQGWFPDGLYTAPTDEALAYDLVVTKNLGFNMLRKHVKVESMRFYYHCDKLGLLVWQDMPSGDNKFYIPPGAKEDAKRSPEATANYEREWKEIIDTRYNAPSIVVWVPFNEGWGQFDTCRILDLTKKLDPTRLVDGPSGWEDRGCGDLYDRHLYRGPGMFPPEEKRATVLGEYGGLGLPVEGHTWVKSDKNWGYGGNLKDKDDLLQTYNALNEKMHPLIGKGLSAAVYTQTTDCEVEVNGLMTYDRHIKVDVKKFKASNDALHYPAPEQKYILPAAPDGGKEWAYTTAKPADGWEKADFNDKDWKRGKSGFGTKDTPNVTLGTEWNTPDIWVRTEFELSAEEVKDTSKLLFDLYHDDDVEVYINGVKVLQRDKWVSNYTSLKLPPAALKAFKEGKNVIAVHCHQDHGGQYIDARIYKILPAKNTKERVW